MADVFLCRPLIGCKENIPSLLVTGNFRYDFTGSWATSCMYFGVKIVAAESLKRVYARIFKEVSNFKGARYNFEFDFFFNNKAKKCKNH
jgi:hypothetical protein